MMDNVFVFFLENLTFSFGGIFSNFIKKVSTKEAINTKGTTQIVKINEKIVGMKTVVT